jgi:[acyl-carrier-protein] S-malonyltransferase
MWVLRHRLDGGPPRRLGPVEAGSLPAAVAASLAGARVGLAVCVTDGLGRHEVVVEEALPAREPCYERDAPEIRRRLLGPARRRVFTRWLDRERAARIRLVPGFEHPGDPRQPDNRHRH